MREGGLNEEPSSEEADEFSLALTFAAAPCPKCQTIAAAGPCPKCGTSVPPPNAPDHGVELRREHLLPLRDAAEDLLQAFDELGRGTIPITSTAFLSGFVEAELFSRVLEVTALGHELSELRLVDPETIRVAVRELFEARLHAVRLALEACRDLASFAPQPPGDRLREIAFEIGRKGARLLLAFLAAVTAVDPSAAYDAQWEIQQ
jgi:hypothetical protein